jgi:tRNA G37 N-methylase Trm5
MGYVTSGDAAKRQGNRAMQLWMTLFRDLASRKTAIETIAAHSILHFHQNFRNDRIQAIRTRANFDSILQPNINEETPS